MDDDEILSRTSHRPFPLPSLPWVMQQSWDDLLFAHWKIHPWILQKKLPLSLQLDTYNGTAYLGITPFRMRNLKFRLMPPMPSTENFLEINVRTYVTCKGKPGIYFFSLDASSLLAVVGARIGAGLPYYRADMSIRRKEGSFLYKSKRGSAELKVTYKPVSLAFESHTGSLEEWLTERYCLFQNIIGGRIIGIDIHHHKWQLQNAEADFQKNTMTAPVHIALPDEKPLLHFSKNIDVLIYPQKFYN